MQVTKNVLAGTSLVDQIHLSYEHIDTFSCKKHYTLAEKDELHVLCVRALCFSVYSVEFACTEILCIGM